VDVCSSRVADEQTAKLVQPGEGAFDDPAVAAASGFVLGLPSRDHRLDPSLPDQSAALVVVVAAVGDDAVGASPRSSNSAAYRGHLVEQREQLGDVVAVAAGECPGERQSASVYEQMVLAAEAASVDRALAASLLSTTVPILNCWGRPDKRAGHAAPVDFGQRWWSACG
jgi:hypothetical protein